MVARLRGGSAVSGNRIGLVMEGIYPTLGRENVRVTVAARCTQQCMGLPYMPAGYKRCVAAGLSLAYQ